MANLWDIIIDAANESETGTPSATTIPSITEYTRWCNKGQDLIASKTGCLEQLVAWPTVAYQTDYTLPSQMIRPKYVEWGETVSSRRELAYKDWIAYRHNGSYNYGVGTPQEFSLFSDKLSIIPATSSSAHNTTVNATIGTTDTTITVVSTSGFQQNGRIKIATSATVYEYIDYTNTTATTFTGCVRGVAGTTAGSYTAIGAQVVTECDLMAWSSVRYLTRPYFIYTTGTATFTLNSATVAAGSTAPTWTGNVYAGMQIGVGTNPSKWYDISAVGANLTISSVFAETTATNSTYVIAPIVDLRTEWYDVLTKYLLFRTLKRKELTQEAAVQWAEFKDMVEDVRSDTVDRSDTEYPVMHDENIFDS